MRKIQQAFRLTAQAAALAAACGTAGAQDADLTKPSSAISFGVGSWSDDRPQLGIYDGMNENGSYRFFDADLVKRHDATGTWFTFEGRNLGLDTSRLRAEWLVQGDMGVFLEHNRITRDNPYTFLTGVQGIGTSRLWVPTPSAPAAFLTEYRVGTERDLTHIGLSKYISPGLDFRLSVRNEDKSGTRQWGRGGAPEFAVEPIDSNTRQMEAVLSYVTKKYQISGGYYGSWYTNRIQLVDTALTTGASQYYLSQPLDNEAHQFFVNGGYNFTPATRSTFKVSYSRATQNEHLPTSDIASLSWSGTPGNLNGRLDTTLVQLGLTSRASSAFSWLANLRYYKSDEKTPQVRVIETTSATTPYQCDGVVTAPYKVCVDNTPLTFETLTAKLEGTYRLMQGFSLIGGIEQTSQDRNIPVNTGTVVAGVDTQRYVPWRSKLDETTYRMQLRRSMSDTVNGSIAYLRSERDGSPYTLTNEVESDGINPIHIADRTRDKVRVMVDWMPSEPLTLTFNVEGAKDEYGFSATRPYGLRDGKAAIYSVDAAYAITDRWQLSAWYTRDNTKATQFGQRAATTGAGSAEKEAHLEDIGDSLGVALRGRLMPNLRVGVDALYSKNVNKYPETVTLDGVTAGAQFPTSGGQTVVGPLPDIENVITRVKLYAVFAMQKNTDIRFDYIHERWKTDDWSWMFANGSTFTYGTTTDGTQVIQAPKQTADFIGVRYIHRFQ